MELDLASPAVFGFDMGGPEGDTAGIVYYIPAGIEPEVRAFFGGAMPDWLEVMPRQPQIVAPLPLAEDLPASGRRTAQWKRERGGWAGR